jgi:hypothetical protein
LMKRWSTERMDVWQRHQRNLVTLSKKHWFWKSDTVMERKNYDAALWQLENVGTTAEIKLLWAAVTKAPATAPGVD